MVASKSKDDQPVEKKTKQEGHEEYKVPEQWRGKAWIGLACDGLTEVPAWIRECGEHVQYLCLDHNRIEELPDWIGELANLETLWVGGNRLTRLPDSIRNLKKLKSLAICDNMIKHIPDWIGELESITEVSIARNPLPWIPAGMHLGDAAVLAKDEDNDDE